MNDDAAEEPQDSQDRSGAPPPDPDPDEGDNPGASLFRDNLDAIDKTIRFVCHRHGLSLDEAEDFSSHAHLKLMENGYAVLRKFQGRSTLGTFLGTTLSRALLDYRNAKWGRWRPSAKAVRLGPPAPLIDQLVYRDQHSADEAFELLRVNSGVEITRAEFEGILAQLPARASRQFEDEEALEHLISTESADKDVVEEEERVEQECRLRALMEELEAMPPKDRLLMKLFDVDGLTMNQVARIVGDEARVLFRRRDRIRAAIRKRLRDRGFHIGKDPD